MSEPASSPTEIKQLITYFKDLRLKCRTLQQAVPNSSVDLARFDETATAIQTKMKDLSEISITDCKATITRAIDELLEIQSKLTLQKIRTQQRLRFNSDNEASQQRLPTPQKTSRSIFPDRMATVAKSQKITKLVNDFKHNELVDIWKAEKQTQSSNDALDRLNKVLLNLTCKVKSIIKDEHNEVGKISLYMLPEFCRVLEELERYKMMNEELMMRNEALKDELLKVKAETFVSRYRPRFYKPGLRDYGCGTEEIISTSSIQTVIKIQPAAVQKQNPAKQTPRFQPLNIKWTDFMNNIKSSVENFQKKTNHILQNRQEESKQTLDQSLLLDPQEPPRQIYSHSNSQKSIKTSPSPNLCNQLNLDQKPKFLSKNIIRLGLQK